MNSFEGDRSREIPLAITDKPKCLALQIKNSHLVESLPYYDKIDMMDINIKAEVEAAISKEIQIMETEGKKDYLESLPLPQDNNFDFGLLKGEMDRVEEGIMLKAIDMEKYVNVDMPIGFNEADLNAWENSIKQVEINTEHTSIKYIIYIYIYYIYRVMNLELMNKYSEQLWEKHISQQQAILKKMENDNNKMQEDIQVINKKRKFAQFNCGQKLTNYEKHLHDQINKNGLLECECLKNEGEIQRLQAIKRKVN